MLKRIFAWVLLIGFLLLLTNIFVIGYQRMLSAFIYIVLALAFLFSVNQKKK